MESAVRCLPLAVMLFASTRTARAQNPIQRTNQSRQNSSQPVSTLPRGKKLILKDGSTEIVRDYTVQGDRVRYYSVERSQYEEIPSSLVDWDATHRAEAAEVQQQSLQVLEEEKREKEKQAEAVDVDASYEVAPGVFLPPVDGLFMIQDNVPLQMKSSDADLKTDKKRTAEQMLVPIPVVPGRRNLQLKGAHAELRARNPQPDFYYRSDDGEEPRVELLQLQVHGNTRLIENVDSLFQQQSTVKKSIPLEDWTIGKGLYRFTVSKPLPAGEYALTILPAKKEEVDLSVWDFGVDSGIGNSAHSH